MKNESVTFETLPFAVSEVKCDLSQIKGDVDEIRRILEKIAPSAFTSDHWLDLNELCEYHPDNPTKATVYSWVSSKSIPVHKSSKRLRFLKSEIDSWLLQGRKKTFSEIAKEAETYIHSNKKG